MLYNRLLKIVALIALLLYHETCLGTLLWKQNLPQDIIFILWQTFVQVIHLCVRLPPTCFGLYTTVNTLMLYETPSN